MVDVDWPSAVMAIGVGRDCCRCGRGCAYIKSHVRIIGDGSAIDGARYGSGASNNTCCQRSRIRTIIIVRHRAQCAKGRSEHDSVAACGQVVAVGILGLNRDGRCRLAIGRNGNRVGRNRCRRGCGCAYIKSHVCIIGDGCAVDGARYGSGCQQQLQLST